jgi:hypothetical protein
MTVSAMVHVMPFARNLTVLVLFFQVLFGDFAEAQSRDFKEAIDEDESTEDYGYLSDSDLGDDQDEKASSPNCTAEPPLEVYEERVERGKVVKIPDVPFVT